MHPAPCLSLVHASNVPAIPLSHRQGSLRTRRTINVVPPRPRPVYAYVLGPHPTSLLLVRLADPNNLQLYVTALGSPPGYYRVSIVIVIGRDATRPGRARVYSIMDDRASDVRFSSRSCRRCNIAPGQIPLPSLCEPRFACAKATVCVTINSPWSHLPMSPSTASCILPETWTWVTAARTSSTIALDKREPRGSFDGGGPTDTSVALV